MYSGVECISFFLFTPLESNKYVNKYHVFYFTYCWCVVCSFGVIVIRVWPGLHTRNMYAWNVVALTQHLPHTWRKGGEPRLVEFRPNSLWFGFEWAVVNEFYTRCLTNDIWCVLIVAEVFTKLYRRCHMITNYYEIKKKTIFIKSSSPVPW